MWPSQKLSKLDKHFLTSGNTCPWRPLHFLQVLLNEFMGKHAGWFRHWSQVLPGCHTGAPRPTKPKSWRTMDMGAGLTSEAVKELHWLWHSEPLRIWIWILVAPWQVWFLGDWDNVIDVKNCTANSSLAWYMLGQHPRGHIDLKTKPLSLRLRLPVSDLLVSKRRQCVMASMCLLFISAYHHLLGSCAIIF